MPAPSLDPAALVKSRRGSGPEGQGYSQLYGTCKRRSVRPGSHQKHLVLPPLCEKVSQGFRIKSCVLDAHVSRTSTRRELGFLSVRRAPPIHICLRRNESGVRQALNHAKLGGGESSPQGRLSPGFRGNAEPRFSNGDAVC